MAGGEGAGVQHSGGGYARPRPATRLPGAEYEGGRTATDGGVRAGVRLDDLGNAYEQRVFGEAAVDQTAITVAQNDGVRLPNLKPAGLVAPRGCVGDAPATEIDDGVDGRKGQPRQVVRQGDDLIRATEFNGGSGFDFGFGDHGSQHATYLPATGGRIVDGVGQSVGAHVQFGRVERVGGRVGTRSTQYPAGRFEGERLGFGTSTNEEVRRDLQLRAGNGVRKA